MARLQRMLWVRGVGVDGGQRPALRLRAAPRTRSSPRRCNAVGRGCCGAIGPALRFGAAGRGSVYGAAARLADGALTLLSMSTVPRWGRGAGVAGARAVRRRQRDGRIRVPCMIRGASAAKRAAPWQDLRAMHSRKAICGAFRIHGARILPKPARFGCMAAICCQGGALFPSEAPSGMHEARNLPRMAARERTTAKYCHGKASENASRENIATDGHPGDASR